MAAHLPATSSGVPRELSRPKLRCLRWYWRLRRNAQPARPRQSSATCRSELDPLAFGWPRCCRRLALEAWADERQAVALALGARQPAQPEARPAGTPPGEATTRPCGGLPVCSRQLLPSGGFGWATRPERRCAVVLVRRGRPKRPPLETRSTQPPLGRLRTGSPWGAAAPWLETSPGL